MRVCLPGNRQTPTTLYSLEHVGRIGAEVAIDRDVVTASAQQSLHGPDVVAAIALPERRKSY